MDTVFYSWQSDLHDKTNRTLIRDAIHKALGDISKDQEIEIKPELDEATRGEPGASHIAEAIFRKIKQATAFVPDVTLVHKAEPYSPNPNVLTELGYAARSLGWSRVIPVLNDAYRVDPNKPIDPKAVLPFDFGYRAIVIYNLSKSDADKPERYNEEMNKVSARIKNKLKLVLVRREARFATVGLANIPYMYFSTHGGSGNHINMHLQLIGTYAIEIEMGFSTTSNDVRKVHITGRCPMLRDGGIPFKFQIDYNENKPPIKVFANFSTIDRKRFRIEQDVVPFDINQPTFFLLRKKKWIRIRK